MPILRRMGMSRHFPDPTMVFSSTVVALWMVIEGFLWCTCLLWSVLPPESENVCDLIECSFLLVFTLLASGGMKASSSNTIQTHMNHLFFVGDMSNFV